MWILFPQLTSDDSWHPFNDWQEWLDANEPIEAIIDGANIGLYNSMFQGFNFNQVNKDPDEHDWEEEDMKS